MKEHAMKAMKKRRQVEANAKHWEMKDSATNVSTLPVDPAAATPRGKPSVNRRAELPGHVKHSSAMRAKQK